MAGYNWDHEENVHVVHLGCLLAVSVTDFEAYYRLRYKVPMVTLQYLQEYLVWAEGP
jgi:hypothetical protein